MIRIFDIIRRLFSFPIRKYSCRIVYQLRAMVTILFSALMGLSFGMHVSYYGEDKLLNLEGTCGTINSLINITSSLVMVCCAIELVNSMFILIEKPLTLRFGVRLMGKYVDLMVNIPLRSSIVYL